jgi:hypothetical protein
MLDPGLLAAVSLISVYVLSDAPGQVYRYLGPRVILLVDSLYAKGIEAVKSRAALSASSPEFYLDSK